MDSKLSLIELRRLTECLSDRDAQLAEATAQFKAFMDNGPQVAFIKDPEGRYTYTNRVFGTVYGCDPASVIGKTDFDLFPETIAKRLWDNDQKVLSGQDTAKVVELVPNQQGKVIAWLVFKFPMPRGSKGVYLGGQGIDVKELKALQDTLNEVNSGDSSPLMPE